MTVMDTRWWAPSEPGIGPDEFDLELLTPGEDPTADLGQAFLALHRVGAAACEAVATQPLADEDALAFALANARKLVAPEASEIISKAVGDNVNYGNLLIRDVLDDAEATALSLWRSCVAKSVPASTTAKRVGMVYGIPPGELFTFQKLATDPKANSVALQEAADKALFTHVAKLVSEEAVKRKVEISKQRPPRAARQRWWDEEPRDETGEWTESPERLGDVEPAEREPMPQRRARRARRAQRAQRAMLPPSAQQHATESASLSASQSAGLSAGMRIGASALLEAGGRIDALLGDRPPNPHLDPGLKNLSRTARDPGDVTKGYEAPEHGQYVTEQLAFTMPADEWSAFVKNAAPSNLGKMFRAGRLQEYIGTPQIFSDDSDLTTAEHESMVAHVAAKVQKDPEIQAQRPVQAHRIAVTPGLEHGAIEKETKRWMTEDLGMSEVEADQEILHVDYAKDLRDPKKAFYAIYAPRPRGKPRAADRPVPQVTTVVVADEDLFGSKRTDAKGRESWTLDRNQMLTTSGVFAATPDRRFWDEQNRVIRNVVYTHVTDEEVAKALTPDRFHALEEQGRIHRDETGEFASAEEVPEEAPTPRRARRAQRSRRAQRALVPRPLEETARASAGLSAAQSAGVSAGLSAAVQEAFRAVPPNKKPTPGPGFELADSDSYTTVPHWLTISALPHPVHPGRQIRLQIAEAGTLSAEKATEEAARQHGLQHLVKGQSRREERVARYRNVPVEDLETVAYRVHELMERKVPDGPWFTLARIKMTLNRDDTANIEVFRNIDNLGPRDVVRWSQSEPADMHASYTLEPERSGRFYTSAMIREWLHGAWASAEKTGKETGHFEDDDYLANPWVRIWRAEPDLDQRSD